MTSEGPGQEAGAACDPAPSYDAAVVGLGPAGISAATELVRYGRSVVAFERDRTGGLVHEARRVENVPWDRGASPGPYVVHALEAHLGRFPPEVVRSPVTSVQRCEEGFVLTSTARTVRARAIVLATGTRPRRVNARGEDLPWVVHRWTDIQSRSGRVAVVGGGDLAVDQALSLLEAGHEVELLVRGASIKCNRRLQDELASAPSIRIRQHYTVEAFSEGPPRAVAGSVLGAPASVEVDGVLVSIGREPEAPRFLDPKGRAMSQDYVLAYGEKGLFPCGDLVARGNRRQVAIAAGSGLDAAMRCDEFLGGVSE